MVWHAAVSHLFYFFLRDFLVDSGSAFSLSTNRSKRSDLMWGTTLLVSKGLGPPPRPRPAPLGVDLAETLLVFAVTFLSAGLLPLAPPGAGELLELEELDELLFCFFFRFFDFVCSDPWDSLSAFLFLDVVSTGMSSGSSISASGLLPSSRAKAIASRLGLSLTS